LAKHTSMNEVQLTFDGMNGFVFSWWMRCFYF
jgi:hypothetical protein